MRLPARIIGLILLWTCPAGLSAQAPPAADPPPAAAQAGEKAVAPTLTPPSSKPRTDPGKRPGGPQPAAGAVAKPWSLAGSLALVLGVFFLVVWLFRRALPQGRGILPPEAFEVLGRAPLANRQQAQLLRCGNKLLLVCVGAAGAETLTEIIDPAEVERLAEVCRGGRNGDAAVGRTLRGLENSDAG